MITSIKTAIDIATTLKQVADDTDLKAQTIDLYNTMISLQTDIMTMQAENHALLQENHYISKKLMEVETWENEKSKYSLHEICPQVFVYSPDQTDESSEPNHWLCAKCYNQGVKSILQLKRQVPSGHYYICHSCGSEICDYSKKTRNPNISRNRSTWI